jgi:hypothetical protein
MLYNVQSVKRYTATVARERLSEALDEVDRGVPVIIERKGVRYRISRDTPKTRTGLRSRKPIIEIVDAAVAGGEWTWDWRPGGLRFRSKRRRA